jgi:hypothetical protein
MGDLAADSGALATTSILSDSSSTNASSDVSKQLPQSAVDAWNLTVTLPSSLRQPKALDEQPVSPNRWPTEAPAASDPAADRTAPSAATKASNRLGGHAVDCSGMLTTYNLGYFVGAVQNTISDLGTADNYSLVADIANALLGSIPYGGAAAPSLVSAWANAQNNAENIAYTAEQRVAEDAI